VSGAGDIRSLTRTDGEARPLQWNWDCSFIEENASGFALGALEPEEEQRIVSHLLWCSSCALLIHEARSSVSYLPFLSTQSQPSPSAKLRLFDRIVSAPGSEQLDPPVFSQIQTLPASRTLIDAVATGIRRTPTRARRRSISRWGIALAPLSALPLVVAIAIVGVMAIHAEHRASTLSNTNAFLLTENSKLKTMSNQPMSAQIETGQTVPFQPVTGSANTAAGELKMSSGSNVVHVRLWNLTGATQMAVSAQSRDGQSILLGTIPVTADGTGEQDFTLPRPLSDFVGMEIGLPPTSQADVIPSVQNDILALRFRQELGDEFVTEASTQP